MRVFIIFQLLFALFIFREAAAGAKRELPTSVAMFFTAIDTLAKADERPNRITPEANLARIKPLMQQVIDAGRKVG